MYTSLFIHWASIGFQIDLTEEKGGGLGLLVDNNSTFSSETNTTPGNIITTSETTTNNCSVKWECLEDEEELRRQRRNLCQEVLGLLLLSKSLPQSLSSSIILKDEEKQQDKDDQTLEGNFHDAETVIMNNHETWQSEEGSTDEDHNTATTAPNCSLCLDDFDSDCRIVRSKCSKFYHRHCMLEWMKKKHDSCPDCNSSIWDHIEFSMDLCAQSQLIVAANKQKQQSLYDKNVVVSKNDNNDKISVASTVDTSQDYSSTFCSSCCYGKQEGSPLWVKRNDVPLTCVIISKETKVNLSAVAA